MRKISIIVLSLVICLSVASPAFAVQDPSKAQNSGSPFQFLTNIFVRLGIIAPDKAGQAQNVVNNINNGKNIDQSTVSSPQNAVTNIVPTDDRTALTNSGILIEQNDLNLNATKLSIALVSPKGGETYEQGAGLPVLWKANNITKKINVSILDINGNVIDYPHSTELLPNNFSAQSIGFATKDTNHLMPIGQYRAKVCFSGTAICDVSKEPFSIVTPDLNVNPRITKVNPQPVKPGQPLEIIVKNAGRTGNIILKTKDGSKTWTTGYAKDVSNLYGWSKYDGEKMTITMPSVIGRGVHPDGWWNEPQVPVSDGEYYLIINSIDANSESHFSNYVVLKVSKSGENQFPVPVKDNNESNSNNSSNPTEDYLTVLTPVKSATGQNVFSVGDVLNIRWSSRSLGITKITLNQSNNASQIVLYSSNNGAPFTGNSYSWIVPKTQLDGYYTVTVTLGNNYKSATSGQFRIINDNYPPKDTREYPDSQIPALQSQNTLRQSENLSTDRAQTVVVLTPISAMNTTLFYVGDKMKIAWNSVGYDHAYTIKLVPYPNTSSQSIAVFDNHNQNIRGINPYTWTVPSNVTSGKYKVYVEAFNTSDKSISGSSEGVITIINTPSPYIAPAPSNSQEMQQAPTGSIWDAVKNLF